MQEFRSGRGWRTCYQQPQQPEHGLHVTDNHSDQHSSTQGWHTCYRQTHSSDHLLLLLLLLLHSFPHLFPRLFLEDSVTSEMDKSLSLISPLFYKRSFVRFMWFPQWGHLVNI